MAFEHSVEHLGEQEAASGAGSAIAQVAARVDERGGVLWPSDALSVVAEFSSIDDAIAVAFTAGAAFSVALCAGDLDPKTGIGLPLARAKVMAGQGHADVTCDGNLLLGHSLPEGIGVFRAPEHREAALTHSMHVLRDYR